MSRREKEGEPNAMEHLFTSAQCVVTISRMQAIFPQRPHYIQLLERVISESLLLVQTSMLEFKVSISSVNKELSKLYDA